MLAADCVYSDGDGESPDPEALCRAAARLLMRRRDSGSRDACFSSSAGGAAASAGEEKGGKLPSSSLPPAAHLTSRVWLASEERDAETHALFERAAARHFASVRRLQLPAEVFGSTTSAASKGKNKNKKKEKENLSESESESESGPWCHRVLLALVVRGLAPAVPPIPGRRGGGGGGGGTMRGKSGNSENWPVAVTAAADDAEKASRVSRALSLSPRPKPMRLPWDSRARSLLLLGRNLCGSRGFLW